MKLLLFIFLEAFLIISKDVTANPFDSTLQQQQNAGTLVTDIINKIVLDIKNSDPYIDADFNGDFLGFPITAKDFTIKGFGNVVADKLAQETMGNDTIASFRLTARKIEGSSSQWSSTDESFYGSGKFEFKIQTLRLKVNVAINESSKTIIALIVTPVMNVVKVAATGVYNDAELTSDFNALWSKTLSKCTQDMYDVNHGLTTYVNNLLIKALSSA